MQVTDEPSGADERIVATDVRRQAVPATRLPGGIGSHLSVQIGQYLAVSLDAKNMRGTRKAHAFQMTEVLLDCP
ncbi:hypothetical protein ABGB18_47910 [Nonomuraea sp. B12E4]|uniref:hypothetical protein n=1 Tax=Nonomuraea sp. B12E4 TaxID=3153564 RepID=UPI00325E8CF2